ncbi:hypothetical protein [Sulfurimonas marina]|uniref:EexN family lipoprotein n=1 Tax=Sulfurimonas marina TaxID=2590551 RepID=A0A7M3V8Y9_9BACT|nr:hypothetical protein [Sulfurimonas marina]QOP40222.1 hypothetical protein FJR03_00085 [Sulfurimonas marina]
MYKLLILSLLVFSGCSHFRITGTMCDNINTQGGEMPEECRAYDEKKADKAFNKVTEDKKVSNKDLEFDKEEE